MPSSITGNDNFNSSDNATQTELDAHGLGVGQVYSSPANNFGTTYTNNTGKPIFLNILIQPLANDSFNAYIAIDGVYRAWCGGSTGDSQTKTLSVIVPNGSTYSLQGNGNINHTWHILS